MTKLFSCQIFLFYLISTYLHCFLSISAGVTGWQTFCFGNSLKLLVIRIMLQVVFSRVWGFHWALWDRVVFAVFITQICHFSYRYLYIFDKPTLPSWPYSTQRVELYPLQHEWSRELLLFDWWDHVNAALTMFISHVHEQVEANNQEGMNIFLFCTLFSLPTSSAFKFVGR